MIFDDVICKGNEETIVDCQYRQPFTSNCGHDEDISVRCFLNDTLGKFNFVPTLKQRQTDGVLR